MHLFRREWPKRVVALGQAQLIIGGRQFVRLYQQGLPAGIGPCQLRPQELALRAHVIICEQDGLTGGQTASQPFCVGASDVIFVVGKDGSHILPGQHPNDYQGGDLQPDVQPPIKRLAQLGRLAPLPGLFLAGQQQQVTHKIPDAQRAKIVKRQERRADSGDLRQVDQFARADHVVEGHINANCEE